MKVYELRELSLKFERHLVSEIVNFQVIFRCVVDEFKLLELSKIYFRLIFFHEFILFILDNVCIFAELSLFQLDQHENSLFIILN